MLVTRKVTPYHATQICEEQNCSSLILKLDTRWAEWSASRSGRFTSAGRVLFPAEYMAECVKDEEKVKISCLCL